MTTKNALYEAADLLRQLGQHDLYQAVLAAALPEQMRIELVVNHQRHGTTVEVFICGQPLIRVPEVRVEEYHLGPASQGSWHSWLEGRAAEITEASPAAADVIYTLTVAGTVGPQGKPDAATERAHDLDIAIAERVKFRDT